jgi:hypothetical protein
LHVRWLKSSILANSQFSLIFYYPASNENQYPKNIFNMETLLLAVPNNILRSEILPFLSVKDIAVLDSAVVNKQHRKSLHEVFAETELCGGLSVRLDAAAVFWLKIRKISLTSLTFKENITDKEVMQLSGLLGNVRYISFGQCFRITDQSLALVQSQCKNLETLVIASCRNIQETALLGLVAQCGARLLALDVSSCSRLSDQCVATVAACCPGLEELHLGLCRGLTDAALQSVGAHCSRLRYLDLTDCVKLTSAGVEAVATGCPDLEGITLDGCPRIGDDALVSLSENCHQLRTLYVNRQGCCGGVGQQVPMPMQMPVPALPGVSGVPGVALPAAHMVTVTAVPPPLPPFAGAEESVTDSGRRVSDVGVLAVSQCCPLLRRIGLAGCTGVTDSAIFSLALHCPMLVAVDLFGCRGLTSASCIQALRAGCPLLCELDVGGCVLTAGLTHMPATAALFGRQEVVRVGAAAPAAFGPVSGEQSAGPAADALIATTAALRASAAALVGAAASESENAAAAVSVGIAMVPIPLQCAVHSDAPAVC